MRTVLILESDAFLADGLANTMRADGWSVLMATTVAQACAMSRLFAIELLIADVSVQDGSGVDAARRIVAARPAVEILFVSGHSRHRLERRLPAAGPYAFLQTPCSNTALLDAVAVLVREHELVVLAATA